MKRLILVLAISALGFAAGAGVDAWAQKSTKAPIMKDFACPSQGGASTSTFQGSLLVSSINASRMGFVGYPTSDTDVFVSFGLNAGVKLSSGNALRVSATMPLSDSFPGVFIGTIACQSVGSTTGTLHYAETSQ